MQWNPKDYGDEVASILALAESGQRLIPLTQGKICSKEARRRIQSQSAQQLFPAAPAPEAAASGLYLYFSCWEDAHSGAKHCGSPSERAPETLGNMEPFYFHRRLSRCRQSSRLGTGARSA